MNYYDTFEQQLAQLFCQNIDKANNGFKDKKRLLSINYNAVVFFTYIFIY